MQSVEGPWWVEWILHLVVEALDGVQSHAEKVVDSTGNPQLKAAFTQAQNTLKPHFSAVSQQSEAERGAAEADLESNEEEDLLTTVMR